MAIAIATMERQLILSVGAVLLLLFTAVSSQQNCNDEVEDADFTCFFLAGLVELDQVFQDCPTFDFEAVRAGNVRCNTTVRFYGQFLPYTPTGGYRAATYQWLQTVVGIAYC